jgi:hypothetical protein
MDGDAMRVNYVWYGDNAFGPLEKFNVYSWKALGHDVTIYAHKWDSSAHTLSSLGLAGNGIEVKNISTIIGKDDPKDKRAVLAAAREVLTAWIAATNGAKPPEPNKDKSHLYNMIDITKSYIGGTRKGIVLDTKVGPSPHLGAYLAVFDQKFVSYSRGRNTAGRPENQCIGTGNDGLRTKYAAKFDEKIRGVLESYKTQPTGAWFNALTGFHGDGFKAAAPNIDVAEMAPGGGDVGNQYVVTEPGGPSHGPFRVFKHKNDQSNTGVSFTRPQDVAALMQQVYTQELSTFEGRVQDFVTKAEAAMKAHPNYVAPQQKPTCSKCGETFKKMELASHEQTCNPCPECGKQLAGLPPGKELLTHTRKQCKK